MSSKPKPISTRRALAGERLKLKVAAGFEHHLMTFNPDGEAPGILKPCKCKSLLCNRVHHDHNDATPSKAHTHPKGKGKANKPVVLQAGIPKGSNLETLVRLLIRMGVIKGSLKDSNACLFPPTLKGSCAILMLDNLTGNGERGAIVAWYFDKQGNFIEPERAEQLLVKEYGVSVLEHQTLNLKANSI